MDTDITIKSDLVEITVRKTEKIEQKLKELYDLMDYTKGDFLTITQGIYEITIITNKKRVEKVTKIIGQSPIKKIIKDLCSLSIIIPEESVRTVGLFYITTRALAWENIPIVEVVSTLTEFTLILNEEDTPKAFKILKEVIKK